MAGSHVRPVLVGGHESARGADLERLRGALPGAAVCAPGRSLQDAVRAGLAAGPEPVVVLPMTWGRDPVMVADTARTLRWLAAGSGRGRIALADQFGTVDHLVALLRAAATRTAARHPGAGLVLAAPGADPFDDAELHRVAHLVRTFGTGLEIGVACVVTDADLARAVHRVRLLGAQDVVVVPAGFAAAAPSADALDGAAFFGPLLSDTALLRIVRERLAAAEHDLQHGHDGIEDGLEADHGHGYAHSHAGLEGAGHEHPHGHGHPHTHPHRAAPVAPASGAPAPARA
ncbi:hypothetical protein J1G44_18210 [Cellulomonas sp. zg-ZUI199]|uniref:Cobalamin biosynthesis protein CbiX n=1 Tax=Cellulomonas wangleii TaxID=2816956 RepID=A0ABX8D9J6_9CELL|nr:hypothetical protein [Cellulomonas wangleii]MBO0926410.1 hypothetical protein [Cellulomonas wangleii]QVI63916.1 hypothetical protein KG103_08905 [Cellulomonas wangleii]